MRVCRKIRWACSVSKYTGKAVYRTEPLRQMGELGVSNDAYRCHCISHRLNLGNPKVGEIEELFITNQAVQQAA